MEGKQLKIFKSVLFIKEFDNWHIQHQPARDLYQIEAEDILMKIFKHRSTKTANILHFFNFAVK